jgi:hypothetical protein
MSKPHRNIAFAEKVNGKKCSICDAVIIEPSTNHYKYDYDSCHDNLMDCIGYLKSIICKLEKDIAQSEYGDTDWDLDLFRRYREND